MFSLPLPPSTPRQIAGYVHWPWCLKKCPYCDFNSHVGMTNGGKQRYLDCLRRELERYSPFLGARLPWISVFFGGGTPSLMGGSGVGGVLDALRDLGAVGEETEITVECNPTSSSPELFRELRDVGVNRVSIGVQGLQRDALAFLGREHTLTDARLSLESAVGQDLNVNADLIYGLPGQDLKLWEQQLREMCRLGLKHISAYQLTVEPNTRFYKDVKEGLWAPMDSDREADFFDLTRLVLAEEGFENYEVSNFARPGFACRHNVHVWRYGDYLGLGAGAHGRLTGHDGRVWRTVVRKMPLDYMDAMEKEGSAWHVMQPLDLYSSVQEAFLMGLRLADGLDVGALKARFNAFGPLAGIREESVTFLVEKGLLEGSLEGRIRLTAAGWPLLNSILKEILLPEHPVEASVGIV